MCPDSELLSAFFDGEVPSPWKEKIEGHIASCPDCASKIAGYRGLRELLHAEPEPAFDAAKERVLAAVHDRMEFRRGAARPGSGRPANLFRRSVNVPLPVAAAIGIVFLGLAIVATIGGRPRGPASAPRMAEVEKTDTAPLMVHFSDMKSVMQYLEDQDDRRDVMIVLPGNSRFQVQGNPQLVRASDYSRSFSQ